MTGIEGFLVGSENPYATWIEAYWTDGSITDEPAFGTTSSNSGLIQISDSGNGETATIIPSPDGQSQIVDLTFEQFDTSCDICSSDEFFSVAQVTVPGACLDVVVNPGKAATLACDGTSTYQSSLAVGGAGFSNVTSVSTSTSTDNVLMIDLLGGPFKNPLCVNTSACFNQDFKAFKSNQGSTSGNVIWGVQVFCGSADPGIDTKVSQTITCQ